MALLSGNWSLETLNQFDGTKWIKSQSVNEGDLQLILSEDYMYITKCKTLIEQLCLSSAKRSTKVMFINNILGFIIYRPQGIAKFNVKFSSNCDNIPDCLKYIQRFMKIEMVQLDKTSESEDKNISMKTVVENLMQKGPLSYLTGNTNMVPTNYPVEQITQLCLLDNELPYLVAEIETILNKIKQDK